MGKSWRKDFNFWDILMPESAFLLFVFCSPYDAKVFFFFFPVGKLLCSWNQSQGLVLSREKISQYDLLSAVPY